MNLQQPINTFSSHYRKKFGEAVGKIPLHAGLVCPNRSKGGCIYCHSESFAPSYLESTDPIQLQLEKGKKYLLRNRFRLFFGYFQQETSTVLSTALFLPMVKEVLIDDACVGVIISTRPDSLDQDLLEQLAYLAVDSQKECIIEIGLQSFQEQSLELLNRNHTVKDFIETVKRVKALHGITTGVHLILGIPGETEHHMIDTIRNVSRLGVDAIKLHHLQIIRDTPLHTMHEKAPITVFSYEAYFELLIRLLPEIPADIVIHRLWSASHPELLVAPFWDKFAGDLSTLLREKLETRGLYQGKYT